MGTLRNALVVLAVLVARAHADVDIKEADRLFALGLSLRESNLEQSCNYFGQSLEKNPNAIGTLMNVALCDEKLGKIASAHRRFSEARDRAKEGNLPEYVAEAESHIKTLEVDLPHVTIKFLVPAPPNTRVLIGETVIPVGQYENAAVDPGELVIVVSAPGRLAYETRMMIAKKETKPIEVPELKKGVTVKGSSRRSIGKITTIVGGSLFLGSQVLSLWARHNYNKAKDEGCTGSTCDAAQQSEIDSARTLGYVATGVGILGVATAGVGLYLWLTAPKEPTEEKRVTFMPSVTPESAGLTAVGRF